MVGESYGLAEYITRESRSPITDEMEANKII